MRTNLKYQRVTHILWLKKAEPWKSDTLSKAPAEQIEDPELEHQSSPPNPQITAGKWLVQTPQSKNHPGTGKPCKIVQGLVCGTGEQMAIGGQRSMRSMFISHFQQDLPGITLNQSPSSELGMQTNLSLWLIFLIVCSLTGRNSLITCSWMTQIN